MPLELIRNDITRVKADVIVNTANPEAAVGSGVDSAIYKAAGWDELLRERKKIGRIHPGEAAVTHAFHLDAEYIIHTVGPAWEGGEHGEAETVASCYRRSLEAAEKLGSSSIAFPLISTGTLGFPKDLALRIALSEISSFLLEHDMTVYLVVYNKEAFELSGKLFQDVRSYIEESEVKTRGSGYDEMEEMSRRAILHHSVGQGAMMPNFAGPSGKRFARPSEKGFDSPQYGSQHEQAAPVFESDLGAPLPGSIGGNADFDEESDEPVESAVDYMPEYTLFDTGVPEEPEEDIERILKKRSETFQQMLFRIIDRKGLDDVDVYKRANLDRKLFSKIKSNTEYTPTKRTACALALSLRLNLDETIDLIGRAGLAFSSSSTFDIIIRYCIEKKIYDIYTVNCLLFDWDQPTLGC